MGITLSEYFLLFVATFALVGFLTPVMRRIAIKQNVFDAPTAAHKTHKEPVPYLGGVAIIVGVLVVTYGTALIKNFSSQNFWLATSVLAPAAVLGIVGLIDDLRNLSPTPRFIIQTIAGIFTAWLLVSNDTVGNPTGSKVLDYIVTIIWIVGICNSINFFDNLDGGAAGTVAVTSIALFVLAFNGQQILIAALAVLALEQEPSPYLYGRCWSIVSWYFDCDFNYSFKAKCRDRVDLTSNPSASSCCTNFGHNSCSYFSPSSRSFTIPRWA